MAFSGKGFKQQKGRAGLDAPPSISAISIGGAGGCRRDYPQEVAHEARNVWHCTGYVFESLDLKEPLLPIALAERKHSHRRSGVVIR